MIVCKWVYYQKLASEFFSSHWWESERERENKEKIEFDLYQLEEIWV